MKHLIIAATACAALCAAAGQAAAADFYGAAGYTHSTMDMSDLAAISGRSLKDAQINEVGFKLGWQANKYLGAELESNFGLNDDKVFNSGGASVSVKIQNASYIYGVARAPISNKFDLLARLGYGHQSAKVDSTVTSSSTDTNDGSVSYGVGAQYMLSPKNGVRVDYTYDDIKDAPTQNFGVSYVRKF